MLNNPEGTITEACMNIVEENKGKLVELLLKGEEELNRMRREIRSVCSNLVGAMQSYDNGRFAGKTIPANENGTMLWSVEVSKNNTGFFVLALINGAGQCIFEHETRQSDRFYNGLRSSQEVVADVYDALEPLLEHVLISSGAVRRELNPYFSAATRGSTSA